MYSVPVPKAWAPSRKVRHSRNVGPSPALARRTASPAAAYISGTLLPSTVTAAMP